MGYDKSIDPRAKSLYTCLNIHKPRSIRELARYVPLHRTVITDLIYSLAEKEWVVIKEIGTRKIMIPTLPPKIQKAKLDYIRECDRMNLRAGEYKMKLRFNQIIDVSPWIDNVRPWFLQSATSGEFLEYDRYSYHARIAGEFQGRQHYEITADYPDQGVLEKTKARDQAKAQLSRKNNVVLIKITPEDLTLENMLKKIPQTVPIRLIDIDGIYARGLEEMCVRYIAYHRRGKARDRRNRKIQSISSRQ